MGFHLSSDFKPSGDQPQAIKELIEGIERGDRYQTLLGVTGSGKTFTVSNVISKVNRPTLIMSHNKTLAAQLYGEFRQFFPADHVEFFISYYDYYQPEAYLPVTDTYIQKDSSINEEIDRLRLKATSALLSGDPNVIVIASVSCIYGIGAPAEWLDQMIRVKRGDILRRNDLLKKLVGILYTRNDFDFNRGTFRVRGDIVEIIPAYESEKALRIGFFGDEIEKISQINPLTGELLSESESEIIYPAKHFLTTPAALERAIVEIEAEMQGQVRYFKGAGKLLEAQRIEQRTRFDIEMMREVGYCSGIENYSRHIAGREPGSRPHCLLDYFPEDFLLVVDESHVSVPQISGMWHGDRARKNTLVDFGFRLPSALDNRPLTFEEWEKIVHQVIFVSATPGPYELEKSKGVIVEQIIRPTGLVDPVVEVRPIKNQIDDLIHEIRRCTEKKERVLVTTLTKRMAEDLTKYLSEIKIRVRYVHSEIDALERVEILRDLRLGEFDVLIGVNLLREGLDLPEVSLVAILDADKEGFLRSERSLIQTAGRTARNANGKVILYADVETGSMKRMLDETRRRREKQIEYNTKHGIIPQTIHKSTEEVLAATAVADVKISRDAQRAKEKISVVSESLFRYMTNEQRQDLVDELRTEMKKAAKELEFERATDLRDEITRLEKLMK